MPLFFGITDDAVEQYLYRTLPPRPAEIQSIEDHAAQADVPVVGPLEGQFLYVLALGAGAQDILEVGTATGYSAAWLGLAARARGGRVIGLERDPARAALAADFWRRSGLDETCSIRLGDAFAVLRTMNEQFDFIFIDILTQLAGPAEGELLADLCIARLRPGGMLVADNALRKGRVADPANREPGVETMRRYLGRLDAHPDFATVIVPLRDGVSLAVRHPD